MHLKCPEVFVMWDTYIRGEKPTKDYQQLDIYANGIFQFKKYPKKCDGYIEFLKDMQGKFKHLTPNGNKTLAKAADEFNFVNITLPIQGIEQLRRRNKLK